MLEKTSPRIVYGFQKKAKAARSSSARRTVRRFYGSLNKRLKKPYEELKAKKR